KTRVVVEQAFGRLKARFSFLKYMRLKDTIKGTDIIDIALILHNFVEKNNDEWEEDDNSYNDEINDSELIYELEEDEDLISRNNAIIKRQNLLELICIDM
ncbi:15247_t:CDS:1, partial [Dentiscutata erythropus]